MSGFQLKQCSRLLARTQWVLQLEDHCTTSCATNLFPNSDPNDVMQLTNHANACTKGIDAVALALKLAKALRLDLCLLA